MQNFFKNISKSTRKSQEQEYRYVDTPGDLNIGPVDAKLRFATQTYGPGTVKLMSDDGTMLLKQMGIGGNFTGSDAIVASKLEYNANRGYGMLHNGRLITSRKGWAKLIFGDKNSQESQIFKRHPVITALHYYNKFISAKRVMGKWVTKTDSYKANKLAPISEQKRNTNTVKKLIRKPYSSADASNALSKFTKGQASISARVKKAISAKEALSAKLSGIQGSIPKASSSSAQRGGLEEERDVDQILSDLDALAELFPKTRDGKNARASWEKTSGDYLEDVTSETVIKDWNKLADTYPAIVNKVDSAGNVI